jgi:ADP-heptose:LPS heptosyltransferase
VHVYLATSVLYFQRKMCRKLPSCDVFCLFALKHSSWKTRKCASLAGGVALAKLLQERVAQVLQQVGARQDDTKLQKAAKAGPKRNVRAPSTIDELARIDDHLDTPC